MNYKTLILEAAHSFIIHSPYVNVQHQLKWADTMLSAASLIQAIENGTDDGKDRAAFQKDLEIMVFNPIEAIAMAYVAWSAGKGASEEQVAALNGVLNNSRILTQTDPIQAKRDLIGALNRIFEHLNIVDVGGEKRDKIPFREDLIHS